MLYGHIVDDAKDLSDEIRFAKENFDFVEITFPLVRELTEFNDTTFDFPKWIESTRSELEEFPVYGHLHWGFDLARSEVSNYQLLVKSIDTLSAVGCRKITVHPSKQREQSLDLVLNGNQVNLAKIADYIQTKNIQLLLENVENPPYQFPDSLKSLLDAIPNAAMTLDTGHANKTGSNNLSDFINELSANIMHTHIHAVREDTDHLEFLNFEELVSTCGVLKKLPKDTSCTLEIFRRINQGEITYFPEERHEILLQQYKMIRELLG